MSSHGGTVVLMEKTKITVPNGMRDLVFEEVNAEKRLEDRLERLFGALGYKPVRTPAVEYIGVFDRSKGFIDEREMYKLTDVDGRLVALRPDNTAPIARLVSTKLHEEPLPLLIRYSQRVYRNNAAFNACRNEIMQCGVEDIGGKSEEEDLRILFTAFEALSLCGGDYKIEIGHSAFFDSLIEGLELSPDEKSAVKGYLAAKNSSMIPFTVKDSQRRAYELARTLPRLCGGREVLDRARTLAGGNADATRILDYVEYLYGAFVDGGYGDRVIIDLGIVQTMEYYTGMVFKGYIAGIGEPVLSGGRYDRLLSGFGRSLPACGFALDVSDIAHFNVNSQPCGEKAASPMDFSAGGESLRRARERLYTELNAGGAGE